MGERYGCQGGYIDAGISADDAGNDNHSPNAHKHEQQSGDELRENGPPRLGPEIRLREAQRVRGKLLLTHDATPCQDYALNAFYP